MSFIRPEVRQTLLRWREFLMGLAAAAIGLWWTTTGGGALVIVGPVFLVGGILLAAAGLQRGRFRLGSGGAGIVQLDERRLTYFGPHTGGTVALENITRIERHPSRDGAGLWVVGHPEGPALEIPANAEGADALFDVFAALPGLRTEEMLARIRQPATRAQVIWQKGTKRLG